MKRPQNNAALQTDKYALTMLQAALKDGRAEERAVFEVFTRSLPEGRNFGVFAGLGRVIEAMQTYIYDNDTLDYLATFLSGSTLDYLADFTFKGNVTAYAEGDMFFANSPVLTLEGSFAEGIIFETLILSILNHDSAVASAAAVMRKTVPNQKLYELGGRRTHEAAAVSAARSAYIGGFDATSNLLAGRLYPEIPTFGSAAHAFTLAHPTEREAFASQIKTFGTGTTLLVDTFDIEEGIRTAVDVAGPELFAIRIDSGDPDEVLPFARELLDELGAHGTNIIFSGDLNLEKLEHIVAAKLPVDAFGVGTDVVLGGGWPTVGFVYKLVAITDPETGYRPVAKKSASKATVGGQKTPYREYNEDWQISREILMTDPTAEISPDWKRLNVPYIVNGRLIALPKIDDARSLLRNNLGLIPKRTVPTVYLPEPEADNS